MTHQRKSANARASLLIVIFCFTHFFCTSAHAQITPSSLLPTDALADAIESTLKEPREIAVINLTPRIKDNKIIRDRLSRSLQFAVSHIQNNAVLPTSGGQVRFDNNIFYLPPKSNEQGQKIKVVYYDFDNRHDTCRKQAASKDIEQIEKRAVLIIGAVSSDCTKSLLSYDGFKDIPIINAMSTADKLSTADIRKHDNLFRTTFPDHYSVAKLIEEIQAKTGDDLRSVNFGLLYNADSDYSLGLRNESYAQLGNLGGIYNLPALPEANSADASNAPIVQKFKKIQLIQIGKGATCKDLELPIHSMLILNSNDQVKPNVEKINACHHNNDISIPQYYAIGSPELFPFLPNNSVVIARPNLEQFENVNKRFLGLADNARLSSSVFLTVETLFAVLKHISGKAEENWRGEIMTFLRETRFQTTLDKSYYTFDSNGELAGSFPSSSIYQVHAIYELKNRISGKDSTLELISINSANRIGWFDGSLQLKIVAPASFKEKSITLRIERDSQIDRFLTNLNNLIFGTHAGSTEPLKTRVHTRDILLASLNNGVYQHLPWFIGDYQITIQNSDGSIISNEVKYVVEWPMHLFITLFIACAVGLLLLERSLQEKIRQPLTVIRYFAGIIITAVVLHLLSVTFRNSDIATFMPFLSFSSNLVTNGAIIGILAGLNGLELIHAFLANIQGRFVPSTDDKPTLSTSSIQQDMKQQAAALQQALAPEMTTPDEAEKEMVGPIKPKTAG